jgi:hypothetical protein
MKENLKDILSNLNPDIDQDTLLLYLQGKLTPEKQHQLEKQILEGDFESEALDGLQNIKDKKQIAILLEQLNHDLKKKTAKRKQRRQKLELKKDPWLWITLLIILLLIVISYVVIHRYAD